ncbi:MAG: T9SS C-terminal target domain-containing protein [Candidatus Hydrogenedentota bacterium]|nr:MAG: T9SS C-terminal target domain-containing protein [Candidatus Hydrogenedentota bacterium]
MKKQIYPAFIFVFFTVSLFAKGATPSKLKAYPNPFSSAHETLTIEKTDGSAFSGSVKITVYDFNLKKLYQKEYAAPTSIRWNGFDDLGRRVRPGIYFIRVEEENTDSSYANQYLKVLVK